MKMLLAATALTFAASAAFAGEGTGNPFPFTAAPLSVTVAGTTSATAPSIASNSDPLLPASGSEGVLQTANSLPAGFEDGAPAVTNLNRNAPRSTRLAQPVAPMIGTHG